MGLIGETNNWFIPLPKLPSLNSDHPRTSREIRSQFLQRLFPALVGEEHRCRLSWLGAYCGPRLLWKTCLHAPPFFFMCSSTCVLGFPQHLRTGDLPFKAFLHVLISQEHLRYSALRCISNAQRKANVASEGATSLIFTMELCFPAWKALYAGVSTSYVASFLCPSIKLAITDVSIG